MTTTEKIQEPLDRLVGMPIWGVGRAADLVWFQFGIHRLVQGTSGTKEVGDYALHVQCPWRITQGDKVVTGRGDIFCTPTETDPGSSDFDWQKENRFDRVVRRLFQEPREFKVTRAHSGSAGNLSLTLEGGYELEVVPCDSEMAEHWRLFKPYSEQPHLVFSGSGVEFQ